MKIKLFVASAALLIAQTAMAAAQDTAPFSCPSVETLKNIGITNVANERGDWYGVILSDKLGTTTDWSFIIGPFEKSSRNELLAKANEYLSTLTLSNKGLQEGPVGQWECEYDSSLSSIQLQAAALTPAIEVDTAQFARLKR